MPKANLFASRLGMTNKYAYDYACEDEYFEREMTLLDAKLMTLPIPDDFKHKELPWDEIFPSHINDVRFNYKPQNLDRRAFIHDTTSIQYVLWRDYHHNTGYEDEDMDYEFPDPYEDMHFKYKRSGVIMLACGGIVVGLCIGYPTLGLKMPQKDNPVQFRKKFGTDDTVWQFQKLALIEYGNAVPKNIDTNVAFTHKGFEMVGNGLRIDLPSYRDLIC
jgi:hypothetical protein